MALLTAATAAAASAQNQKLTVKEYAEKLYAAPRVQILDVRTPAEFAVNHIENAVNIDPADSSAAAKIIASLDPSIPTFTYSIREGRSSMMASRLKQLGFKEVYYMPDGMAGWVGAGYPLLSFVDQSKLITPDAYAEMIASNRLLLVDFSSNWCSGCRKLQPVLEELGKEHGSTIKIVTVEFDENPDLVKELKVKALPTLILYRDGAEVWTHTGVVGKEEIEKAISGK